MLTLPTKIFLCKEPVNMRMSFEGLGTVVEQLLNRPRNCLKALFWDRDGFCIWYKRLERGAFVCNMENQTLDPREFLMLLEGITPQKMRPKFFQNKERFPSM
jgi:transposase